MTVALLSLALEATTPEQLKYTTGKLTPKKWYHSCRNLVANPEYLQTLKLNDNGIKSSAVGTRRQP